MTNPTTPFNWQMPQSTDLVTDLPADFETFGQAVATSMADLLGGTTGQILSKASNTDMDFTWVTNDVGDITAVTAGTGITGGGTSGAVTVSLDQANFGGGQFAAGKNKIINGDFSINQRGFTSSTASGVFNFDRYDQSCSGGTVTFSAETFALGTAPVSGYEGKNYLRYVVSGQSGSSDFAGFGQRIESVRTFAGQTITVSFWAKAATGTPSIAPVLQQSFGTGGSPSATVQTNGTPIAITTSWARYSQTFNVPSIAGKTLGTNNNDLLRFNMWGSLGSSLTTFPAIGLQNNTFDFWGIQVEAGSTATPFQTATGTIQGELAACRRYLPAVNLSSGVGVNLGYAYGTNAALFVIPFDVVARTQPTGISIPTVSGNFTVRNSTNGDASATTMTFDVASVNNASVLTNGTLTAGTVARLITNAGGYILFTGCEL